MNIKNLSIFAFVFFTMTACQGLNTGVLGGVSGLGNINSAGDIDLEEGSYSTGGGSTDAVLNSQAAADATSDDFNDLIDDEAALIGTGGMNPEQIPVTMSKETPEDEDCNQTTEGEVLLMSEQIDESENHNFSSIIDGEETTKSGNSKYHSTMTRALRFFEEEASEDPEVYQCQVFSDSEEDDDFFIWVKVPYEDILDLFLDLDQDQPEEKAAPTQSPEKLNSTKGLPFRPKQNNFPLKNTKASPQTKATSQSK